MMWVASLLAIGLLIAIGVVGAGAYCLAEWMRAADDPLEARRRR